MNLDFQITIKVTEYSPPLYHTHWPRKYIQSYTSVEDLLHLILEFLFGYAQPYYQPWLSVSRYKGH